MEINSNNIRQKALRKMYYIIVYCRNIFGKKLKLMSGYGEWYNERKRSLCEWSAGKIFACGQNADARLYHVNMI